MNTAATLDDIKSTAMQAADKTKAAASQVAGEVKSTSSVIGNEVKNFIADLEELVTRKTEGTVDVNRIKSDITGYLANYKAQAKAAGEHAISQVKHGAEGVNSYVHEDPWKAIGVSFAVGLLLGVVVARR